jgi:hypothetical protein
VSADSVPFSRTASRRPFPKPARCSPTRRRRSNVDVGDDQDFNRSAWSGSRTRTSIPVPRRRHHGPVHARDLDHGSYVRADYDGDGVAELRKVTVAGSSNNLVLDNEEVDDHPFAALTPIPMPHKFFGMSIADQTMDLQLIKSTLFRGMLDSMYLRTRRRWARLRDRSTSTIC